MAASPRENSTPARKRSFASFDVFNDVRGALPAWRALAASGAGSIYQTEAFLLPWLETLGRAAGVTPFFIVARDGSGAPTAFLPLALCRYGPWRVAQFLGGKHSNYNLGLFRSDALFDAEDLRLLLLAAAAHGRKPHLYFLTSLPLRFNNAINPLAQLPNRPAADSAHMTRLAEDGAAFLTKTLSGETRKKLRNKNKRLAALAPLRYFRARNPAEAELILDAFFKQKRQSYATYADEAQLPATKAFFTEITAFGPEGGQPAVELHALAQGDKIIATFAAGLYRGRLQGMFNSFDAAPEIARSSPGDLLLTHVIRDACACKLAAFDLGLGDARYKAIFCNEVEPMVDALPPTGLAGQTAKLVLSAALAAKHAVKSNPRLRSLIKSLSRARDNANNSTGAHVAR
jgi:CelD/BcsL family acetyltransferase involved in cellulose biosynthesis